MQWRWLFVFVVFAFVGCGTSKSVSVEGFEVLTATGATAADGEEWQLPSRLTLAVEVDNQVSVSRIMTETITKQPKPSRYKQQSQREPN